MYVQEILKPILKSQVKNNLTYTFNNHPASFMLGGAKLDECKSFCKTGLVNLSLALNLDPKTVANYQARINSDDDLVTTVVKATTLAELEKLQARGRIIGQAAVENQTGIFAEGGAGRPKFTPEDDTFIFSNVLQDVQFSSQR